MLSFRKLILVLILAVFAANGGYAQIYEPEGLRMPGDWNGWTNTHNMGGDFDLTKVTVGAEIYWKTEFVAPPTTNPQEFKFASGPSSNEYENEWTNTAFAVNSVTGIYIGGPSNNSINTVAGKTYTVHWKDNGYYNTSAIFMETTDSPQSFAASDAVDPANPSVALGQDLNLTITLAGNKSPEEKAFVRYTKDGYATSSVSEVAFSTGTSSSGTAVIPGSFNTAGGSVSFYVYTTTVSATGTSNHDLIALKIENNGGANYAYTVNDWVAINDGNWDNTSTWESNTVPVDGANITISANTAVTVNVDTAKIGILHIESGGSLVGNPSTTVAFPGGGYTSNSAGTFKPYNMVVGQSSGTDGADVLYIDYNIEVQNDFTIRKSGKVEPGDNKTPTITMSGTSAAFSNYGLLDCNPDPNNTSGEKLAFRFSGSTILEGNGSLGGVRTKFSDITIPVGGALSSDAAGVLQAELQFGTLECDGSFNMGQTTPGNVNFTVRGTQGNVYTLKSSNPNQIFQFHHLLIGNASESEVRLGLASGSESVDMRISGNFEIYSSFDPVQGANQIKTVLNGAGNAQILLGEIDQTTGNTVTFSTLEINNSGGSVELETLGGGDTPPENITFVISDALVLTNGRLITFDSIASTRHKLLLEANATIDYSGAQSGAQSCYIDGPITRAVDSGPDQTLTFPVGGGSDFRLLEIITDVSQPTEITVEHFDFSANFDGMTLASPLQNISDVRFWNIKSADAALNQMQIKLHYGDAQSDGVTSESDLRIVWAEQGASSDANSGNDVWKNLGPSGGGASNIIQSDVFDIDTLALKIDITLGNVGLGVNPLPVSWLYFKGAAFPEGNRLEWATSTERNTAFFEIESAPDARHFVSIGKIEAQGYSQEEETYHFIDLRHTAALSYYRIRQVDKDGKYSFSEVIALSGHSETKVYPNPFREKLTVEYASTDGAVGLIRIFNSLGQPILQERLSSSHNQVSTQFLAPGFYTAFLVLPGRAPEVFKLVKSR